MLGTSINGEDAPDAAGEDGLVRVAGGAEIEWVGAVCVGAVGLGAAVGTTVGVATTAGVAAAEAWRWAWQYVAPTLPK